jgi:hypothetical protein
MSEVQAHAPGTFCWADLATTDAEGAKKFYTELFGWEANDLPAGEAGTYTMLQKEGKSVCALYGMEKQMRAAGLPPFWQTYVCVKRADQTAEKAQQLGGKVIMPPFDVMDAGRMALVEDTQGAKLALWESRQHVGAQVVNEPGAVCWNELYTHDPAAATRFYTELFGWITNEMKGATGQPYTEFRAGEQSVGGMMEIQKEWGEVPSHWAIYFCVDDCDAAIGKAKGLGAKIEMPPMEIENVGKFAVVQDPQGGHFLIIQMVPGMM